MAMKVVGDVEDGLKQSKRLEYGEIIFDLEITDNNFTMMQDKFEKVFVRGKDPPCTPENEAFVKPIAWTIINSENAELTETSARLPYAFTKCFASV